MGEVYRSFLDVGEGLAPPVEAIKPFKIGDGVITGTHQMRTKLYDGSTKALPYEDTVHFYSSHSFLVIFA